jgi:uncharacterized protein (DUF58 family)
MRNWKKSSIRAVPVMFIVLLLCLTFMYAMFQGGFVSWFLFYSFAPFGCYSLAVMIYPLHRMSVQRKFDKQSYRAGDELTATITITRNNSFPLLYIMIQDQLPPHLGRHYSKDASKIIVFPLFRKEIQIQYSLLQLPRGDYSFKEIKVQTGDFFGLVTKESFYIQEENYLVYPKIVPIKPETIWMVFEEGTRFSRHFLDHAGEVISGIREYQAGDRFAWVDWKASAKKNILVSKEFDRQKTNSLTIVMDGSSRSGLEPRIMFTASILAALEKRTEEVHFMSLGETVFTKLLKPSLFPLTDVLRHLAVIQGEELTSFPDMLHQHFLKRPLQANIVLIVTEVDEALKAVIEAMIQRRHPVLNLIVMPTEQTLTEQQQTSLNELSPYLQWRVFRENDLQDFIT